MSYIKIFYLFESLTNFSNIKIQGFLFRKSWILKKTFLFSFNFNGENCDKKKFIESHKFLHSICDTISHNLDN